MIRNFTLVLAAILFSNGLISCANLSVSNRSSKPVAAIAYDFSQGQDLIDGASPSNDGWTSLSLREKIGQTMIVVANHHVHVSQFGSIDAMMKQYPIGGVFIPSWIYSSHKPASDVIPNIRRAIAGYQQAAKYPLIISEDFERGVGDSYPEYTSMPTEMSVGAANSPELARQYGATIAREAHSLGVNWLLHPVSDLSMNPLNDLILERATSDDPSRAYPLLKAQMAGMHQQGVVSTIKHFPGDGVTMKNQHLVTSTNTLSLQEWHSSFGNLYQKLINDGAPSIMVGHIRFPAYQTQKIKGFYPPATLSSEIVVNLLKKEMKFNGVVMSDALNMGGVSGYYANFLEAAVESFKAGVDIVLWPDLAFMDEIEKRIKSGEIPMSRLDDAVSRIWAVRGAHGLVNKKTTLYSDYSSTDKRESRAVARQVAESAVTLLEDKNKEIPIGSAKHKRVLIISISFNDTRALLQPTVERLRTKGFEVDEILHNPISYAWESRLASLNKYDKILVVFANRISTPMGSSMLKGDEAMGVWMANLLPFEKLIAISYGNPYYLNYYLETAPIKVNAYSLDPFSQAAVVDAITGSIPFIGTSPVILDHDRLQ